MNIDRAYLEYAESFVEAKVCHKFGKIEAEAESKAEHRREVISWAKVADQANYRLKVSEQRRQWVNDVVKFGLASTDEAMKLAAVKFKL